jgi:hypothetical protein
MTAPLAGREPVDGIKPLGMKIRKGKFGQTAIRLLDNRFQDERRGLAHGVKGLG